MMAPTAIERHNNQINDTDLNEFLFQSSFEKTNMWVSNQGLMHATCYWIKIKTKISNQNIFIVI